MISNSAKRQFLSRELNDFDWMKRVPEKELDDLINNLDPKPIFHTEPFRHQKICFIIGINFPEFLFLLDLGAGKTKIVLDLFRYYKQCGEANSALVLVPNIANIDGWRDEIEIHAPDLSYVLMTGTKAQRLDALNTDNDLYILNYDGFVSLCKTRVGKKSKIYKKKVSELFKRIDFSIFDECTAFKNKKTLTFRSCNAISHKCVVKFGLTGTPFGRDPIDLWSQFYVMDNGETLGRTIKMFQEVFFSSKLNYWGGLEYTFKKNMTNKLYQVIKNKSIYYSIEECSQNLPAVRRKNIVVDFSTTLEKYYETIKQEIIDARGNYIEMENAFMKMRQLASGFLRYKDEEGEVIDIDFGENPKLDALMELVDEMPVSSKMIIIHNFIHTGKTICEALDKAGISHRWLSGVTKDESPIKDFKTLPDCRILVMNHQSGSKGLNLQCANYVVFVESPVSPLDRKQCEGRCYRTGQKKTVMYYDILMRKSIDFKIQKYLKDGENLFDALIRGVETFD